MVTFRNMEEQDIPTLYDMALHAFQPDYEKYGAYPPLLKTETKNFRPFLRFGKVILADEMSIGGIFVMAMENEGEIGSLFIDPKYQKQGYGRQVILEIEKLYPKVKQWKLDTPSENYHLHRFYESLDFIKTGEIKDSKSDMILFIYEKSV